MLGDVEIGAQSESGHRSGVGGRPLCDHAVTTVVMMPELALKRSAVGDMGLRQQVQAPLPLPGKVASAAPLGRRLSNTAHSHPEYRREAKCPENLEWDHG